VPTACWFDIKRGAFIDPETGDERTHFGGLPKDLRRNRIAQWLAQLKQYVESYYTTPDLWSAVKEDHKFMAAASSDFENRVFTGEEQAQIASHLDEIRAYIETTASHLDESVNAHIDHQFTYLKAASNRLGRKDWLNVFISTLMSIAVAAAFAPNQAQDLFRLAKGFFQPLIQQALALAGS
jgi:hypothetical protein